MTGPALREAAICDHRSYVHDRDPARVPDSIRYKTGAQVKNSMLRVPILSIYCIAPRMWLGWDDHATCELLSPAPGEIAITYVIVGDIITYLWVL